MMLVYEDADGTMHSRLVKILGIESSLEKQESLVVLENLASRVRGASSVLNGHYQNHSECALSLAVFTALDFDTERYPKPPITILMNIISKQQEATVLHGNQVGLFIVRGD